MSLATLVEQLGFHTLSIYDDLFFKPAWPILSIVAANTSTIRVGPAVVNPYLIHPAITAGNIALLDEISGGRAYLGIGKGAFLDFVGVETPTPITAVRETIDIVQRLLDGSMKGYKGDFFNIDESASFRWKPVKPKVPIVIGTWGQRMAELAGKVADEVKASPLWDAGYATQLLTYIHKGAVGAGRDINDVSLCLGVLTSVSEDAAEAREYARRALAIYLPHLSPMTEAVGPVMKSIRCPPTLQSAIMQRRHVISLIALWKISPSLVRLDCCVARYKKCLTKCPLTVSNLAHHMGQIL